MEKRSCFNCTKTEICFVFKSVRKKTTEIGCNIDGNAAPGKWVDIFTAIGECCLKYSRSTNK